MDESTGIEMSVLFTCACVETRRVHVNESGSLLMPKDYLSLAESAGIMSVIDNVMLYRSVQVLRRLERRSGARGVFCNISAHSLLDPEFFPEFISFMEQNQALSESMYFEFTQSMMEHAGHVELESLAALSSLGFQLSLDQVTNLDMDFQTLQDRGFRFMKLDADILIHGMSRVNAQIHAADMRSYLERYGIKLIISKIEDERTLTSVLDYNMKLDSAATLEPLLDELPLINELRQSIESNRIELHLQPIMTLPQRRVRYYEAFTRLRNESGSLLMPKDYLSLAESAGIMSVIDNVMLYRSVQVLRRLERRSGARGVFCNISAHSLLDPEFFPEFISFMEQNQALSESMYFEFTQSMMEHAGHVELESLAALSSLGFQLSLDQVTNLDMDFQTLQDRGFRFMKLDADILIHGMSRVNAQIHAADMRSYLERYGIKLIISKIEDERTLTSVLDYNMKLGQGFLFSEPRPVRPEVFVGAEGAEEAA